MNIIIPIGGSGRRFEEENYNLPKPLIKSLGKSIIFWNIDHLLTEKSDTIHIVYRKEFDIFNFRDLINNRFHEKNIRYVPIENDTRGAAETVLYALESMDNSQLKETTLVVDSDNFYREDIVGISRKNKANSIFYTIDTSKSPIFSYINMEENGDVIEIREKEKISDFACVGAYCFESGEFLLDTIKDVLKNGHKDRNEYYISDLYKRIISLGNRVKSIEIKDFTCLGTPNQLKSFSSSFSSDDQKYRFCFDLDNTLVSYPKVKNDYNTVEPIQRNIDFCNFLNDLGHTVIIYTARRMRTHKGNVGAVIGDIGKITLETLERFNIKYTEIHFGKPYAHFYIDDLAVKSYDDLEKETGFYNMHPSTRSHNRIEICGDYVIKYSRLIEGERHFYMNMPSKISEYFPRLLDHGDDFIKISRIEGVPVSFLNTSGILTDKIILDVLNALNTIHSSVSVDGSDSLYLNYYPKFIERVESYDFSGYPDFEKIKDDVSSFLKDYQNKKRGTFGVIHGDPVFTNILLNNKEELKFIDMRGKIGGEKTIYGDIFYDYAKIYQSIIGYDFILMNKNIDTSYVESNKNIFKEYVINRFGYDSFEDIRNITKSLIISLIPIHDNEKCPTYFNLIKNV